MPYLDEMMPLAEKAFNIIVEELKKDSIEFKLVETFIPADLKTTGIKGDNRVYEYFVAIKIHKPNGEIFMDYDFLSKVSNKIVNEVHGITRVIYYTDGKSEYLLGRNFLET